MTRASRAISGLHFIDSRPLVFHFDRSVVVTVLMSRPILRLMWKGACDLFAGVLDDLEQAFDLFAGEARLVLWRHGRGRRATRRVRRPFLRTWTPSAGEGTRQASERKAYARKICSDVYLQSSTMHAMPYLKNHLLNMTPDVTTSYSLTSRDVTM